MRKRLQKNIYFFYLVENGKHTQKLINCHLANGKHTQKLINCHLANGKHTQKLINCHLAKIKKALSNYRKSFFYSKNNHLRFKSTNYRLKRS